MGAIGRFRRKLEGGKDFRAAKRLKEVAAEAAVLQMEKNKPALRHDTITTPEGNEGKVLDTKP